MFALLPRKCSSWLETPDLNYDNITGDYYPTVYFNEFWFLKDKLVLLNETVKEIPVNLELGPISLTRWQLYLQVDQSFQIHRSYGSMLDGQADELKVCLSTYVVTDVTFWAYNLPKYLK